MRNQKLRLIARLDVKSENVVKGVHLEGLRIIGKPHELSNKYHEQDIDELIYVDSVASLYGRNSLGHIVESVAKEINVPVTVEGGIRSLEDIKTLLRQGADKVAINTAAVKDPNFITEAAKIFGSQCIVLSIAVLKKPDGSWEAYTDNGREKTGLDALEWAIKGAELGAGEILLTSIDQEGTKQGFDLALYEAICDKVDVPVIASGGAGTLDHLSECANKTNVSGLALASMFHYEVENVNSVKEHLKGQSIDVRYNKAEDRLTSENRSTDKTSTIGVIDYGAGNIFSIMKGIEKTGHKAVLITEPEQVNEQEKIILPGVGSYQSAMALLQEKGFVAPIKEFAKQGKPLLGICLGAQMLLSGSDEFGHTEGLDLIAGKAVKIEHSDQVKVPHTGWTNIEQTGNKSQILSGLESEFEMYFVHSYKMVLENDQNLSAFCNYGQQKISAVIENNNVYGCQFHPEKSSVIGLNILANFADL
jgi:imidazole glycerol phosphate synthase glutamine amidotransferase subunit